MVDRDVRRRRRSNVKLHSAELPIFEKLNVLFSVGGHACPTHENIVTAWAASPICGICNTDPSKLPAASPVCENWTGPMTEKPVAGKPLVAKPKLARKLRSRRFPMALGAVNTPEASTPVGTTRAEPVRLVPVKTV